MTTTTDEKKRLPGRLQEGEGLFQEFKQSLEKLDRAIVAFANTRGGVIYLGVDDEGNTRGLRLTNRLRAQIQDIARNLDPSVPIDIVDLGKAIAVKVKEGSDKPYRASEGFFLRVGASNQKLTRNEILDLAMRFNRVRYEGLQRIDFHYPKDFSDTAFDAFIHDAKLGSTLTAMSREELLISLAVAERQRGKLIFNHAGILFFAQNPQHFIPQAKLSYARYQGTSKTTVVDRKILTGTLAQQLQTIMQKLLFDIPVHYELADRLVRREHPAYPPRAIEEAIVNALIHRDYSEEGAEIQIDLFSDRLEINNPGDLLAGLEIADLGKRAIRRNPLIAELFYRLGYGEKLGSGIVRMRALMHEWKLSPPEFDLSGQFFSVVLRGPSIWVPEEKVMNLPERPQQFIQSINQIPQPFSANSYAERFSITPRSAQKDLELLIRAGLIEKQGQGKNSRYRVCRES